MPKQYEAERDALIKAGKSEKAAKAEAAATWNKQHPDNTNPWLREKKSKRKSGDSPWLRK